VSMATLSDELLQLAAKATALAEATRPPARRRAEDTPAWEVAMELLPAGARLYASQALEGRWYWYAVMPHGWEPKPGSRNWLRNPSSGQLWDHGSSPDPDDNSERAVLFAGLRRILESC
jgi:hypothetical protein